MFDIETLEVQQTAKNRRRPKNLQQISSKTENQSKALTDKALVGLRISLSVNNFSRSKLVFKFFLCIPSSLVGAVLTVV